MVGNINCHDTTTDERPRKRPGVKKEQSLRSRQKKERRAGLGMESTPLKLDVLGGCGGTTNRPAGNIRFRDEARKLRGV